MRNEHKFMWSDNWYIEDGKAWFIDGQRDMLFCMDMESKECEFVTELPNLNSNKFRLNSSCMKIGNEIFCMPNLGDCIWVYNIETLKFKKIVIENPNKDVIYVTDWLRYEEKIYILAAGLKKIIEIDIEKKVIDNYYMICSDEEEKLGGNVKIGTGIYCISLVSNLVYRFDLESKETAVYIIPEAEDGLYAISYDGRQFWLSGYRREVYIWNRENNSIKVLKDFPEQFGSYNLESSHNNCLDCTSTVYNTPIFAEIKVFGQYVWCIPFLANKIIYVDKDTYEIFVLEINDENETRDSLISRPRAHKYLLEYIRDERYIGLFSLKNNYVIEIDTEGKCFERKEYVLSDKCRSEIVHIYNDRSFYEEDGVDRLLYENILLNHGKKEQSKKAGNIGLKIYETLK